MADLFEPLLHAAQVAHSVVDTGDHLKSERCEGSKPRLKFEGRAAAKLPENSVFRSLAEASDFFQVGSLGYSATSRSGVFDGLELRTFGWALQPLAVARVESSFFENPRDFSAETVEFDCALLMQGIEHEWRARESLCSRGMN